MRVIDALAVFKRSDGDVEVGHVSNLATDEAIELGSMVGALVGIGVEADAGPDDDGDEEPLLDDADVWDVLEEIPTDSAAALILLEHQWAVPLRDAVARAGGYRIADGFVSPRDLVAFGLHTSGRRAARGLDRPSATRRMTTPTETCRIEAEQQKRGAANGDRPHAGTGAGERRDPDPGAYRREAAAEMYVGADRAQAGRRRSHWGRKPVVRKDK